jgi:membrane-anchored protein YejM (alkaline phosphatase superfamily)
MRLGHDLKATAGTLVMLAMGIELLALMGFAWFRQRCGKPVKPRAIVSWVIIILTITIIAAIIVPPLVAAQK